MDAYQQLNDWVWDKAALGDKAFILLRMYLGEVTTVTNEIELQIFLRFFLEKTQELIDEYDRLPKSKV